MNRGDVCGRVVSFYELGIMITLVLLSITLLSSLGHADEIVNTATSAGEVAFLLECSGQCNASLYDGNTLLANGTFSGSTWGIFQGVGAGRFNLSLFNTSGLVDTEMVNTGTFNPEFPGQVNDRLGKEVVGGAVLLGVGLGAALLGFEGGFLIIGLVIMIEAEQGYAPEWTVILLIIFAAVATGLGLYMLFGGLK